jgi:hypothetical protein
LKYSIQWIFQFAAVAFVNVRYQHRPAVAVGGDTDLPVARRIAAAAADREQVHARWQLTGVR